jgi:hypothetical protein
MQLLGLEEGFLINFPDRRVPIEFERHTVFIDSQRSSSQILNQI